MRRGAIAWGSDGLAGASPSRGVWDPPRVPVTIAALLAGLVSVLAARTVVADDCTMLPSPVYVTGSTAVKPLLAEVGKLMAAQSPPVTVVYLGQGSCTGVEAILSGTLVVGSGSGALSYWTSTAVEVKCDVAAPGVLAHVGISDVFASTCFQLPGGLPSSVADILGPVQAMTFVAHKGSIERAISAEAAYYVLRFWRAIGGVSMDRSTG